MNSITFPFGMSEPPASEFIIPEPPPIGPSTMVLPDDAFAMPDAPPDDEFAMPGVPPVDLAILVECQCPTTQYQTPQHSQCQSLHRMMNLPCQKHRWLMKQCWILYFPVLQNSQYQFLHRTMSLQCRNRRCQSMTPRCQTLRQTTHFKYQGSLFHEYTIPECLPAHLRF
jgi:hypothetical protein